MKETIKNVFYIKQHNFYAIRFDKWDMMLGNSVKLSVFSLFFHCNNNTIYSLITSFNLSDIY